MNSSLIISPEWIANNYTPFWEGGTYFFFFKKKPNFHLRVPLLKGSLLLLMGGEKATGRTVFSFIVVLFCWLSYPLALGR